MQEESWLILVQILHVVLQLAVWSQVGSMPGVPDSTVDSTHLVLHNENPSFPEAGRFLSSFTSSLLRLQINYTTCCRVCGWAWNWPSIFVSQSIVLVTLCSLGSESALLKHPFFHFSFFFVIFVFFPPPANFCLPFYFFFLSFFIIQSLNIQKTQSMAM